MQASRNCVKTLIATSCRADLVVADAERNGPVRAYPGKFAGSRIIHRLESPWIIRYSGEPPVYLLYHFRARFRIPKILYVKLRCYLI